MAWGLACIRGADGVALVALLACAACSSSAPYADTVDASYDASWKNNSGDAATGRSDATTQDAMPDAAPDQTTADTGGPGADGAPGDDGGSDATPGDDAASEAGDAAVDAEDAATEAGDASTDAGDASPWGGDAATEAGEAGSDAGCTLTSCGAQSACSAGQCVTGYRVFVTSGTFTGALGGALGADASCQTVADGAGLGGKWKAWVSDPSTSPSVRFDRATVPYRLLDGTVVATSYATLTGASALDHAIDLSETGALLGAVQTWTATTAAGALVASGCTGFTVATGNATPAVVGSSAQTSVLWTESGVLKCVQPAHLYCFEQ